MPNIKLPKVKIVYYSVIDHYSGDYDDIQTLTYSNEYTDWEEITEEDLNLLRDKLDKIPCPKGFRAQILVQSHEPLSKSVNVIIAIAKEEARKEEEKQKSRELDQAKRNATKIERERKRKLRQFNKLKKELNA